MHILTTSAGDQDLKVVLRSDVTFARVSFQDKSEGSEFSDNTNTISQSRGVTTITVSLDSEDLVEGRFYSFTIDDLNNSNAVVYRGLAFCTDQTIDQDTNDYYSVNDGEYVSDTSYDNDYIII